MFSLATIPAGFQEVPQGEVTTVLSNSGARGLGYFFANDVIVIDQETKIFSRPYTNKDANGQEHTEQAYYIGCTVNGNSRLVPMAAFRRFPTVDASEFAEKSPVLKALYIGSDADRLAYLKGKTLKVREMVACQTRDWAKSTPGNPVTKTVKFPILDEA